MKDYNSTFSLGKLQAAAAHLLSQLLEERLFMPTPDSCSALRGLMASMLTYKHLDLGLDDVATGEDKHLPLPPDCALIRPPTHRHYVADPPQPPPHVSETAEETAPEGDNTLPSHVTVSRDQQNKRSKRQRRRGKPKN